jgi:NAD-reducing hydrogenase large subunit
MTPIANMQLETAAHPETLTRTVIEPITRVEGHGKVTLLMDDQNHVKQARLHIVEFRGFEKFIQGRPYWEIPVLVQRLCGICPVSHHLAAAKAMDVLVGARKLTPTAEKLRRLLHYGQTLQSHALHFFHLSSPDLLFGFDAEVAKRNVVGVIAAHPGIAVQGVKLRKYGQEVIRVLSGKRVHGDFAIAGGVDKGFSKEDREYLMKDIDQVIEWSKGAVDIARGIYTGNLEQNAAFGAFRSNFLSMTAPDGGFELYDGKLRATDASGGRIFDQVDYANYLRHIHEEVKSWSYMKFPFIKALGPEEGWYRVGPLARMNTASFIDTPLANAAQQALRAFSGGMNHSTLANHWARMIEVVHCVEKIRDLLHDPDLQGTDLVAKGERRFEGIGVIEAPRGNLIHHYKVDENDQATYCNLIVSTTHNNEGMNRAVKNVAITHLSGQPKITEGMLNHVEVAIRAYEPCLSCATHALGQMPLQVEILAAGGQIVDRASQCL